MGWRGYIHHPRKTVFFWSQKAACTSLFGFLAEDVNVPKGEKKFFHVNSQPYPQCLEALRKQHYRSVILVRHPVTRIISAYINKFCQYRSKPLLAREDLEPFAQDLHDLYCQMTGADVQANTLSFTQFLETVRKCRADHPNPEHPINGHWETQVPGFLLKRGLYYDTVLHVENLEVEMAALARELDMPYTPRQMNRTHMPEASHEGRLVDIPACEISSYNFSYDNFITSASLASIKDLYGVDFKTFGYPLKPRSKSEPAYAFKAPLRSWRSWLPYFPR